MSLLGCRVVAVEGTHCTGKTTLAAALVEQHRATGRHVRLAPDPARASPLIAAVVDDPDPAVRFDVTSQLDLVAAAIVTLTRAAHGQDVVVVDKTVANVIAYAEILLPELTKGLVSERATGRSGSETPDSVLRAAWALCQAWQPYDLVIRCTDRFPMDLAADPFRSRVHDLQHTVAIQVTEVLVRAGYPVIDLPAGLSTPERIDWITGQPEYRELNIPV